MQISNRDVEEVRIKEEEQIKDDVLEIVNIKKDEARKHADEDVIAIPQYNKPKKANNEKVLSQGESFSSIVSYFLYFFEIN